jgi:hypothetical protein
MWWLQHALSEAASLLLSPELLFLRVRRLLQQHTHLQYNKVFLDYQGGRTTTG